MLTPEFSLIWSRICSLWSGVWMAVPFESEFSAVFITHRYFVHKIPALVHILNNMNLDCATSSCFWRYILILSCIIHRGCCKSFLSVRFLYRNLVSSSLPPPMSHVTHAFLSSLYHRPSNFGKISHCDALHYAVSPSSFYLSLRCRYLLEHPVFIYIYVCPLLWFSLLPPVEKSFS